MKDFWKKYKLWLNIAIFMLLLGAVAFFVIYPLIAKIAATSDKIQEKMLDDEISQSRIAKIPEMEAAQQTFQDKEQDLNSILDENSEIDFIKKLEALAEATGNKIDLKVDDNPQKQASADKTKSDILSRLPYDKYIVAQISLEGGYPELVYFIHKLENFDYYINVIAISAVKNMPDQASGTVNTNPFAPSKPGQKIVISRGTVKSTISVAVYLKK